jgi:membrane-bound lytic murein transglycosylase D
MLRAVARAAEVAEDAIRELNPHLVKGVTPPGQSWTVRLPPGRRTLFAANFERVAREERLAMIEHEVRRGETLSHIAQRYGTSLGALEMANVGITPQRIYEGQRIRIPVGRGATVTTAAVAATPRPPARVHWKSHRVRPGDSLWSISRSYGVSVDQLRAWNALGRRSTIMVGQNLRIRS